MTEWRQGWPLLLAATAGLSFAAVPAATLGVFMLPLEQAFGWSRATITLGLLVFALVTTPLSPFAGALVDRFGPRAVAIPGMALAGLCLAAFGMADGSTAMWIVVWAAYSLAALLIRSTVWGRAVSGAFDRSRGLALAILLTGTSVTSAFAPLIAHALIRGFDWQTAYFLLGVGWAGTAWILILLFFRERPTAAPAAPGTFAAAPASGVPGGLTMREALRSPPLVRIALAVLLQTTIGAGVGIHLVPIHVWSGLSAGEAAAIASLAGLGSFAGKIAAGWLADRVRSSILPLAAFALPALGYGLILWGGGSIAALLSATVIIGIGGGAAMHMVLYLTTQYAGLLNFGKIYGSIAALMGLAGGLGPLIASLVHDAAGSYGPFLIVAMPLLVVAGLLVFGLGPYPEFRREKASASAPAST